MHYPNEIQAALLFDRPFRELEAVVRSFQRLEQMQGREPFHVPEAKSGAFCRLFGQDDLMITLEYLAQPANTDLFQQPLASTITSVLCPDVRQRLMSNRSHVLVTVAHGVLGSSPEVAQMLAGIGRQMEGHSLPQFRRRLDACATVARLVCDEAMPQVVHWTQSNLLIAGEKFDANYICGSAGNAALMAFTRALGGKSLADNIRVVGINPGPVGTDRHVTLLKTRAKNQFGDENRYKEFQKGMPLGRPAHAREIGDLMAFLASDRSGYTSGVIFTVDGGHTSGWS